MAAKIQLKNGNIGNFGGIFSTFDSFDKIGLSELIDNSLETRDIRAKYSYSDIIKNLTAIYLSGGDAIEDINICLTLKKVDSQKGQICTNHKQGNRSFTSTR